MVLKVWRLELLARRRVARPAGEPRPRPGSSRSAWSESWGSWGGRDSVTGWDYVKGLVSFRCLVYFLPGTTLYVTLTVEELPTVSMAVTANVLVPLDDVLTRLPFATGPVHDVIPAPPSLQA